MICSCGLSPYLRGTQTRRHNPVLRRRFIPVLTGNTAIHLKN
ncbi:hypothetical protein XNW1_1890013 [Xenorhabdus nematophila str. Websteri]|nr:hypothetical protein XNW1_1890013 [Xenorhabdus nematophila str. Websteri]